MALQPGAMLNNRYRIVKLLGQGGFGAVYRAWDSNLNRPCAVKENLGTSPEEQRQFNREASLLANTSHPNLPRVTDYFVIQGQGQYLVMDYVEGRDLQEILAETGGPLPEAQVVNWIGQICDALSYLHTLEPPIIHRDIKPANIKIAPTTSPGPGRAMLVDFGIAKAYDPHTKTTLGARAITPGYSPIEQYGQGTTDARSDIYALGATLYTMLTGQSPPESIQRQLGASLTTIRQLNPAISPSTEQAIMTAMAMMPDQRFQSAADFKATLNSTFQPVQVIPATQVAGMQAVSTGAPLARPSAAPPRTYPPSADAAPRRARPWLWIGLAGGLALVALVCFSTFGALIFSGGGDESATATPIAPEASPIVKQEDTPTPGLRSPDRTVYLDLVEGEPDTLDPAMDYEPAGHGVIMNVYDTLVFISGDGSGTIVPQLASDWAISPDQRVYTFQIRQGVRFLNGTPLTPEDVAYTFRRLILQGGSASPAWLFTEPLLGVGIYDIAEIVDSENYLTDDRAALAKADPARLQEACVRIMEAIQPDNENWTVTFHLNQPWAPFLTILAQSWGAVQLKEWMVANGGWDGDCGTWQNYYGKSSDELNQTPLGKSAMGTGPYTLDHWTPGQEIVLIANENYWRKEPAWEGGPSGPVTIKKVVIKSMPDFGERLNLMKSGEADAIESSTNSEWAQLDAITGRTCFQTEKDCYDADDPTQPLKMIRGYSVPTRMDLFLNWTINTEGGNDLLGSGQLDGNGIPPDFFSDVHVRRAFASCFDYDRFLVEILFGEGERSVTVMLPGMIGHDKEFPHYAYDPNHCSDEFKASTLKSPDGRTLWDVGFRMKIPYISGSQARQLIANMYKAELAKVNSKFVVEPMEMDADTYNGINRAHKLPMFYSGWIEDYHDTHNWVVPYTIGTFGWQSGLPESLRNEFVQIINRGASEIEPGRRSSIYMEFNQLYYEQAVSILLYNLMGRHYQQKWVHGWRPNPAYPFTYYYMISKD